MKKRMMVVALGLAGLLLIVPGTAFAHCDALDGPVVKAARAAIAAGNVTPVLPWVEAAREPEIKAAFERTLQVRKLGGDAQQLADTWFFETVVRIHRAGEGAGFDGLKPAGHIDPVIAMVDATVDTGSADALVSRLTAHAAEGVKERFEAVRRAKAHAGDNVEAGRHYVAAYVDYMHYVEGLHLAASAKGGHDR